MTYDFIVDELPGSYWYHTHSGMDRVATRGLLGALTVLPALGSTDVHGHRYDEDKQLIFGDLFEQPSYVNYILNAGGLERSGSTAPDGTVVGSTRWFTGHVNGEPNKPVNVTGFGSRTSGSCMPSKSVLTTIASL